MNKIKLLIVLLATTLFWGACDKDVDLLADYEDITIVYGLLDPEDSISYLRIEKAYLTDGKILDAAQIQDSNQYSYKLEVSLKSSNRTISFDTTTVHNKEGGIFYAPDMQVYYAETNDIFVGGTEYQLEIKNPVTGKVITSSTSLLDAKSMDIDYPRSKIALNADKSIEFESIANGRQYQVNIRFHYLEVDVLTNDSSYLYVDWLLPELKSQNLNGGESMFSSYSSDDFYNNLLNNIGPSENKVRFNRDCDVIISCTDETYSVFMDVSEPSTSLVIDRPSFTNIVNGYGILASRSSKIKVAPLSDPSIVKLRSYEEMNFQ